MKEIKHFLLPENTNRLYTNEAISSISLTREVAKKINELVDVYNEFSKEDLQWKHDEEGKISKAILYMKDNLVNTLNDLMEMLKNEGFIDERIEENIGDLVERLDNLLGSVTTGSTTMDAEIIDMRVGIDRKAYSNAGLAIRQSFLEVLSIMNELTAIEWVTYSNPLLIITNDYMRFLPNSQIILHDMNYSYVIEGYDNTFAHIFTSPTLIETKTLFNVITSERVEYIKIKLQRVDGVNITLDEHNVISTYLLFPKAQKVDKTLSILNAPADAFTVGKEITSLYDNLLSHTVKESYAWTKVLETRYQTDFLHFDLKSTIQLLSSEYKYGVRGYDGELTLIYDSGWKTNTDEMKLSEMLVSERIRYCQFVLEKADGTAINDTNVILTKYVFEPLVLPTAKDEVSIIDNYTHTLINDNLRVISHRGYNFQAPENTMPAFKMSVEKGYKYIETDISFTRDNVPVLLHDTTIDRTSNSNGDVTSYTYNQLLQFDFGSWFSTRYALTRIPTLEEFLKFCKYTGVHPYLELKYSGTTEENVRQVVNLVKKYGMMNNCTFASAEYTFLNLIVTENPTAKVLLSCQTMGSAELNYAKALKTDANRVGIAVYTYNLTEQNAIDCMNNDLELEMWVVNGESAIPLIHPYVTGVITDNFNVHKYIYEQVMK